jgi:predicted house-cleaning noncanonical NTP pyrophosphatase (MazG superfamily)
MSAEKYNLRNPAVKRIVQELKEIQRDDNPDILAEVLEVRYIAHVGPRRKHT